MSHLIQEALDIGTHSVEHEVWNFLSDFVRIWGPALIKDGREHAWNENDKNQYKEELQRR